jgi:hypothetical protein
MMIYNAIANANAILAALLGALFKPPNQKSTRGAYITNVFLWKKEEIVETGAAFGSSVHVLKWELKW